jgi:lipoprotein-releasing system ATP-binding protein
LPNPFKGVSPLIFLSSFEFLIIAVIQGKNITKKFGDLPVLRGVDLSVQTGEVVSLVGPSGSGKSTLLHILGTLDTPDQGSVEIAGTEVTRLSRKELAAFRNRSIGFVFQFHHLLPEFSALENVCIPGWLGKRSRSEVKREAAELLELLGLTARIDHRPNQLSGGEQQRVAVARALINKPAVVFADEPTGNLDTHTAQELHRLFFDLRDRFNQTFLIVTHNEELAALSDRCLRIRDGQLG